MNSFCKPFFQELERDFMLLKSSGCNNIVVSQKIIFFLEKKMKKLFKWVEVYQFETEEEEIYFFKELKPSLISKILFYKQVLKIESSLPCSKKQKRKHYIKALDKASTIASEDPGFYQYYRSRATYKDESYFIRRPYENSISDHPILLFFDAKISTSRGYQVANLICSDMLIGFLECKIEELNQKKGMTKLQEPLSYSWSGKKIDLVELIYALKHAKLINNGNVDVKELAKHVGEIFNIELEDNIYRIFQDIKLRKTVRPKFINHLAENLNQKLNEEDL